MHGIALEGEESNIKVMEWSSLELKLLSCRDLKAFNFFHKLSVYAVVSLVDEQVKKELLQRQKTPVDRGGGGSPEWNHSMQFDLRGMSYPERGDHLFLKFELRIEGVVFGNKNIGEVCVPLKDLIEEFNSSTRFVSYQVRSSDGKANGVLNFCYKVRGRAKEKRVEVVSKEKSVDYGESVKLTKKSLYPCLDDIRSPPRPTPCPSTTHLPLTDEFYSFPIPRPIHADALPLLQLPALDLCYQQYHYQWPCCYTGETINACNYHALSGYPER